MFHYEKKLQFPVKIATPNPKLAAFIISQYGGPYFVRLQKIGAMQPSLLDPIAGGAFLHCKREFLFLRRKTKLLKSLRTFERHNLVCVVYPDETSHFFFTRFFHILPIFRAVRLTRAHPACSSPGPAPVPPRSSWNRGGTERFRFDFWCSAPGSGTG